MPILWGQRRTGFAVVTIAAAWLFSLIFAARLLAAPRVQGETTPLRPGGVIALVLDRGESITYIAEITEESQYRLSPDNDMAAALVDVLMTNSEGEALLDDTLSTHEFELAAGVYTLQFTATKDVALSVVLLGWLGKLSADSNAPGELVLGGIVQEENVDAARFGMLTIPETRRWMEVVLSVEADEGGSLLLTANGDDVNTSIDSSDKRTLRFWTQGGDYVIAVEPSGEPANLILASTLGGPPAEIDVGGSPASAAVAGESSRAYQFTVSEAGALVTVDLTSEASESDLDLDVGLFPGSRNWTSTRPGAIQSIHFVAPRAGSYFVEVHANSGEGEYHLAVEETGPAPEVAVNGAIWGVLPDAGNVAYRLQVEEPGQLLTVVLLGPEAENFDLEVIAYDDEGAPLFSRSGDGPTAEEIVGKVNAALGLYEIRVQSTGVGGDFVLITRLEDPYALAGQWAVHAIASSQYSNASWSAMQAAGAPDTPRGQDLDSAWAPAQPDGGLETLELTYTQRVIPLRVAIYETYTPGGVVKIEAYDSAGGDWVVLWEGEDDSRGVAAVFSPPLNPVTFATNMIRITLDTTRHPGYEEIDAVLLAGRSQTR